MNHFWLKFHKTLFCREFHKWHKTQISTSMWKQTELKDKRLKWWCKKTGSGEVGRGKRQKKTSGLTPTWNEITFKCFYSLFHHISKRATAAVCKAGPKGEPIKTNLVKLTVSRCCFQAQSEVSFVTAYFPTHLQPIKVLPQGTCRSALTFLWIYQHEMENTG